MAERIVKDSQGLAKDLVNDCISRTAAIDALDVGAEFLRRVLDDADIVGAEREKYKWGLGLIESCISDMKELPSAQPETAERTTEMAQNVSDSDLISRKAAIDALRAMQTYKLFAGDDLLLIDQAGAQTELMMLPPAQPKQQWIPCSERLPDEDNWTGAQVQYSDFVLMTVYNA